MSSLSAPPDPDAAAASDASALEMADVVTAIFRMLDDNIGAVMSAGDLASSRVELAGGADVFSADVNAHVSLVGVAGGGLGTHGPAHG